MSHTRLPWVNGLDMPAVANNNPDPRLIWAGSLYIGSMETAWISEAEQAANAEFIVRACNNFDALLAACEAAWNCIAEQPQTQARVETAQMIQAAIAKATSTKE